MEHQHLAIATVPIQSLETLYDWDQALATGTIFPGLNKPFFVLEENPFETGFKPDENASPEQQERERLMKEISALSFALDDTVLYLDTHPESAEAMELRKTLIEQRKGFLKEFDEKFYALTKDCMGCWGEGPMPWEGACILCGPMKKDCSFR